MRLLAATLLATTVLSAAAAAQPRPRNVVLFVADGLRAGTVTPQTAPAMDALLSRGVRFVNSHSLFPTFTMANASGLATGHALGDTGTFSNTIYTAFPVPGAGGSPTPFIENDQVLGEIDEHFAGNYLNEVTILEAARRAGLSTAAVGKLGPTLLFDHTERTGKHTVTLDDSTGRPGGIPLSDEMMERLRQAGLPAEAPGRGDNGKAGSATTPGTTVANVVQQRWFVEATTKVILPWFKQRGQPFALVFWSRDPDGTQHNQGDSLGRLVPGINGPTSLAAIRNADDNLGALLAGLQQLGMLDDTDVVLTADHGFSTISKESATSWAAQQRYADVPAGQLPPGFVAIDLAHALGLKLFDPDKQGSEVPAGAHPSRGNGLIGSDPARPDLVVAANGGSDLIYVLSGNSQLAQRVANVLSPEDYTSGLFVDDSLGAIPGTLPLSAISLRGSAMPPRPAMVINFRSFSTGCADPTTCGVEVADHGLRQGQGMHGNFSRADTRNIMGAAGPSFRRGWVDPAPVSNADLGKTIARILDLRILDTGQLVGRVLNEAAPNGAVPPFEREVLRSQPDVFGHATVVLMQRVGDERYFDAAGYPGRTLGLPADIESGQSLR